MKAFLSGAALLLGLAGQANAETVDFYGVFQVTSIVSGCEENRAGEDWTARYRPNITGNRDNVGTKLNPVQAAGGAWLPAQLRQLQCGQDFRV